VPDFFYFEFHNGGFHCFLCNKYLIKYLGQKMAQIDVRYSSQKLAYKKNPMSTDRESGILFSHIVFVKSLAAIHIIRLWHGCFEGGQC
jgi:hypothetical protein